MKTIEHPFTQMKVKSLKLGEIVRVSGTIFTARDALHRYLASDGQLPQDLKDGAIYHCGPTVIRRNAEWIVRAAGPTTSMRQEMYMPKIIEKHKVRMIIGKGGMGKGTQQACARYGCVYLQAVGGAAAVLAEKIKEVVAVHFAREFGVAEALWELVVEDFPAIVSIDARGRSLHSKVETSSKRALNKLLKNPAFRR